MSDNPYPSPAATDHLYGPRDLHTALGVADDDPMAARRAVLDLVRDRGIALPDTSRRRTPLIRLLLVFAAVVAAIVLWVVTREPWTVLAVSLAVALGFLVIWWRQAPVLVCDQHGVWIVKPMVTTVYWWVAFTTARVADSVDDSGESVPGPGEIELVMKPGDHDRFEQASYSGRYRLRPQSLQPKPKPEGARQATPAPPSSAKMKARRVTGVFQVRGQAKVARIGMDPDYRPLDQLVRIIEWCIEEFGTPLERRIPRKLPVTEKVVVDEHEFDA